MRSTSLAVLSTIVLAAAVITAHPCAAQLPVQNPRSSGLIQRGPDFEQYDQEQELHEQLDLEQLGVEDVNKQGRTANFQIHTVYAGLVGPHALASIEATQVGPDVHPTRPGISGGNVRVAVNYF